MNFFAFISFSSKELMTSISAFIIPIGLKSVIFRVNRIRQRYFLERMQLNFNINIGNDSLACHQYHLICHSIQWSNPKFNRHEVFDCFSCRGLWHWFFWGETIVIVFPNYIVINILVKLNFTRRLCQRKKDGKCSK